MTKLFGYVQCYRYREIFSLRNTLHSLVSVSDKRTERVLKNVLPPFFPRDHQPVENIIEGERDNVVQPEDGGGGQDRGVDNEDGEEEEGETEERPGHEVA